MNNFSTDGNEQNQEDLINELIQAHTIAGENSEKESPEPSEKTEEVEEAANTEITENTESTEITENSEEEPVQEVITVGAIENIDDLIQQADQEAPPTPKTSKKFVINIQNEYIEYFEELLPEKRSELINNFLKNEVENVSVNRRKKLIARFLKHLLIILITIVVGFPIIFYVVNSSIQSTLKSYNYMQVNFERLYQQKNINKF